MDEKTGVIAGTRLPQHYGSDPVRFSGHPDALLERHLMFNDLIDPSTAGARQTFEAAARSSTRCRLWRQDHQHSAALEGGGA
ncbi:MAG TPA: hypothetical protein VHT03_05960 [Rhizomicrobium sp.]|nr:hypothetical protein [Rhizomicrobium sp.]